VASSRPMKILAGLLVAGMMAGILGVAALFFIFQHYSEDLPSVDQLANYSPPMVTRLYANDSKLLAEYATEKRIFVPLASMPDRVKQAFISAEDRNFYEHQGVDLFGIVRAIKENLMHIGESKSMVGGSTITQQVVKNFLLTSEKSFERKIKEAILAYRISKVYSKQKILELYLNQIYLGRGTYGVAAAAINFFDKSLDQLSIEEAAMLAAMPKAPAFYDPARNYEEALARRNYVIGRMLEDGVITQEIADKALQSPIILRARAEEEVAHADFFAEEVRRRLSKMYGSDVLYKGGLFVKTTVNHTLQDHADRALRYALLLYDQRHGYRGPLGSLKNDMDSWQPALEQLRKDKAIPLYDAQALAVVLSVNKQQAEIGVLGKGQGTIPLAEMTWARRMISDTRIGGAVTAADLVVQVGDVLLVEPRDAEKKIYKLLQIPAVNGAMVVMDPHTGKVLAMSGGYSYSGSEFNRATQAKRQPGSAFKPFVYLTALENGFSPTSIIMDAPVELPQGPGLPMWRPKNYEGKYLGPSTLRTGLEKSRNAMTVRLAQFIGLKRVKRMGQRFGIYSDKIPVNFSMVLGAMETTLLKLTNAYSMLANGGRRVEPWLIERIDDRNGTTIFRRDTRICDGCKLSDPAQVSTTPPTIPDDRDVILDPRVAYQITSILEGAIQRGTGMAAKVLNRPIAGKTGTTNESRDTWFMGYTPDLVVGTYVGFDTPKPMGDKETGGRVAIQAFIHFMQNAFPDGPATPFRVPEGIRKIPVNGFSGQPLFEGEQAEGGGIIEESFLVGGPIFKPQNELDEETKEREEREKALQEGENPDSNGFDPYAPVEVGVPLDGDSSLVPGPGEVAPYQVPQRPVENPQDIDEGFNPNSDAELGTGGLY
jgi:penicillin-binding protein 1A